ncbi:phage tail protein [Burkholderia sp. Bp9015]|nr:phage tail protein [Burkholderia sp. Bp9015]
MMMSLDQFVFSLSTAPFKELQRQRNWKHRTTSRVGTRDASQFTGAGSDSITLNGMVAEDNSIGTAASLDELAKMADAGEAYVLVDGTGVVYGAFVIESLNETETYHTPEGVPRKIDFNLTITRVDDTAMSKAAADEAAAKEAGKVLSDKAAGVVSDAKKVLEVGRAVYTAVRNVNTSSALTAATTIVGGIDSIAAAAGVKGLSTASGISLSAAISAAKDIAALSGKPVGSIVIDVLNRAVGK